MTTPTNNLPGARWAITYGPANDRVQFEGTNLRAVLDFVLEWRGRMTGPVLLFCMVEFGQPGRSARGEYQAVTSGRSYDRFARALDVSQ